MKTPNYHDFYQKALIPMGINDLNAIKELELYTYPSPITHWLIAVEGELLQQSQIYYHWKVSVYPADSEGDFNWKKPFYCSPDMKIIDNAIDLASSFEIFSKKEGLCSLHLHEKIS